MVKILNSISQQYIQQNKQKKFLNQSIKPVAVRALEPSRGPIEGGTFVNVTGSGFSARAALLGYVWCRFNSTVIEDDVPSSSISLRV